MGKREFVVYIAGKYTADSIIDIKDNILLARAYAIQVWELGFTAICPHLNTAYFESNDRLGYEDFIEGDLEIIKRCDAMLMVPNWTDSLGAAREREHALKLGKPVFQSLEDLAKWQPMMIY